MAENRDYSPDPLWYVIHTFSGYEKKVAQSIEQIIKVRGLQNMIQQVVVPMDTSEAAKEEPAKTEEGTVEEESENNGKKKKSSKNKEAESKLFPGYVLVKMICTNDTWYLVRNIRGCTGFVGPDSEPIPLTEEEVARMGITTIERKVPFKVGDYVKIVEGLLEGQLANVVDYDAEKGMVTVTVNMFGRETPTELPFSHVVAID